MRAAVDQIEALGLVGLKDIRPITWDPNASTDQPAATATRYYTVWQSKLKECRPLGKRDASADGMEKRAGYNLKTQTNIVQRDT